MTSTKTTFPDAANVLAQKNGVKAYGIYMEAVEFSDAGKMARHVKMLVMKQALVSFERHPGKKSARWRLTPAKDLDIALREAEKFLKRYGRGQRTVVLRNDPLLVELTAADFTSMESGDTPYSRYVGSFFNENRFGKVDDETTLEQMLTQLGGKAAAYSELAAVSTSTPAATPPAPMPSTAGTPGPSAADIAKIAGPPKTAPNDFTGDDFDIEPF